MQRMPMGLPRLRWIRGRSRAGSPRSRWSITIWWDRVARSRRSRPLRCGVRGATRRLELPEIPCSYLDPFGRTDVEVADIDVPRAGAVAGIGLAAAVKVVAATVGQRERLVIACADAAQQGGQIGQLFRDDMDDLTFLLQLAAAGEHRGGQYQTAVGLEHIGPEDQIGVAGLILDGDEQHAAGAAGTLADQDDAGDLNPPAIADRGQVGTANDAAGSKGLAQE